VLFHNSVAPRRHHDCVSSPVVDPEPMLRDGLDGDDTG
jgi:hypothetical protein